MKNQSHINDLLRTQKVLSSCNSKEHVDAAIRYFRLFIKKWKHLFSVEVVTDLEMNFTIDVAKKLKQIQLK
jgi:hypothetical protein